MTKQAAKNKTKKRVRRNLVEGKAYIHASYNNTIVTITDMDGNAVAWSSSGSIGYKGSKKGTPYAAQLAAADATRKAQNMGVTQLDIVIRGTGSGREQAIRSIQATGVNVRSIVDATPVPHNGCRPRKRKRV
ncbi:30S ribosomal protein S11 [Truepera radiovictrix]|uniref:Small ribosomal subunit protein uS11 n=1 Tax=Truepera radiovictrix (strain DSM 17093 / CIP 108686 / LMG 22925 / RQ-24) TaxID=649638 RepID=D7CVG3_TRURR|nr:30S ribosomal protein S11 [Truepera radiovictrix]ADI14191.1 30S ribosomal protein S11 [Truepera radiovictrix DSM 17093]WMT57251.1 30S ribosomal protein S11 [Truepera radiovictrix]